MEYTTTYINPTILKYVVTVSASERSKERNLVIDALPKAQRNEVTDADIETQTFHRLFDEFVPQAVEHSGKLILAPVNMLPNEIYDSGETLSFAFEAETLPEIELPEISSINVKVEEPLPDPREFHHAVDVLRRKHASIMGIQEKRFPKDGDVLRLDINAESDGKLVPSMTRKDFTMLLHPKRNYLDIIEKTARELLPGEFRSVNTTIPVDYPDPSMRGHNLRLSVYLKGIYKEKLPDFDETFAVSLGFKTLEQLKSAIFNLVMGEKIKNIQSRAQQRLVESLIAPLNFSIPESLLRQNTADCIKNAEKWLRKQNKSDEETANAIKSMQEELETQAKERAKIQTVLLTLAVREHVSLSQEETDQLILKIADQAKQDYKKLHSSVMKSNLINELQYRLLANKALDYLYKKVSKTVVDSKGHAIPVPEF